MNVSFQEKQLQYRWFVGFRVTFFDCRKKKKISMDDCHEEKKSVWYTSPQIHIEQNS